jgi:hypothetical protein
MKSYNTIFYLLFVLLIMGAFASMAQNTYGLRILGGVAIVFGLVFLFRFLKSIQSTVSIPTINKVELVCLSLLSSLLACRIFHIYFPFLETAFALTGLVLSFVYAKKMILHSSELRPKNAILSIIIFIYYLSLCLSIIALVAVPFLPQYTEYIGIVAFTLLAAFIASAILRGKFMIDGADISVFRQVISYKDNSVLLLSLFLVGFLYIGLVKKNILPAIYSDDFPQAYFTLVNNAESGKEKPVEGKYKHEEFKARYDAFLKSTEVRVK